MKQVAILLVATLMLSGCTKQTTVQEAAGAIWQAQLIGGEGQASGFSFNTEFTFNGNGALSFINFEFLNNGACFPYTGVTPSGSLTNFIVNQSTLAVTGDFSLTVQSGGNTLTLTGPLTGTATETGPMGSNTITLSSASVIGTWTLTGSPGCTLPPNSNTSFTMTESTT
jgi:hypothetical protein